MQDLRAELNTINIELSNEPLPISDPEYPQEESDQSKWLSRKEEIQKRIPYLQERLDLVLNWPD